MNVVRAWVYFFIGGFGFGVFFRSFFPASGASLLGGNFSGFEFSAFIALLALGVALLYLARKKTSLFLIAIVLLGTALGLVRFDIANLQSGGVILDALVGTEITAEGVVVDEPDERETNTHLTLLLENASGHEVNSKILLFADVYPQFVYGDRVEIVGVLQEPEGFVGDDGKYFDYTAFLGKDDIFYTMFFPEIELLNSGEGNPVRRTLFAFKRSFLRNIEAVIPDPQSSLLGGLVVGAKQTLGEELLTDFRATGIVHIVVLSGYNVTIVAEAIMRTLSFLPQAASMTLGATAIVFFAVMTGAGATIVRASIMALLVILARATGRTYAMTRALFLAGFLMVLQNPKILVFDTSFQLSFVATLGLIYLAPKLEEYFGWMPTRWQLREFLTATIATQLFVLPILLYKMGELSLVAVPVNLLILPTVPIVMLVGFITGMVGFVGTLFALPFAYVTHFILTYQLIVVDLFAGLPFASLTISNVPFWAVLLSYSALILLILRWKRKR